MGSGPDCVCVVPSFPDSTEGFTAFSLSPLRHSDGPELNPAAGTREEAGCAPETAAAAGGRVLAAAV